jgi:AAA domain (dynein-related subfamily)
MSQYLDTCTALGVCLVANVPVVLWGDPGQGKTSVVEQVAADLDLHLETVIASIREPSDFAGLPVVDPVTGGVSLAPPAWAQRLSEATRDGVRGGIQFYDEISTAPPAVQAALLRPILSGWVGDLHLPDSVRTVAAANPADVATDGWDLAPPMANRFTHLTWSLPADVVREGFAVGFPRVAVPQVDPEQVARALARTKIQFGAFLGARPELVTRVPGSSRDAGMAFPTPRSWEMAARLHATATVAGCGTGVLTVLLGGTVGLPAATELLSYLENLDLPDPEVLLASPETFTVPGRGDQVYAVAAAVWAATLAENTPGRWVACGRVLARVADAGSADIAYSFGTRWAAERPAGALPTADTVASLGPILTELGLLTRQG